MNKPLLLVLFLTGCMSTSPAPTKQEYQACVDARYAAVKPMWANMSDLAKSEYAFDVIKDCEFQ